MLRGLTTISYWAEDLPAATASYTELLGIEPYLVRPVEGRRRTRSSASATTRR
jgi:hypothetical protein